MTIELRLTDVDPPAAEPKRTIYRDIVNLPDPVKLGITIRYFNYDDVGLYMQITGSGTGYTFGTVNLGLLGSGSNAYINLDQLASKTKPSTGDLPNGEMEENITLILRAYTDSGYTILKWTYERIVTVHWINSADAAFTVDFLDNFDDGTVQGWSASRSPENATDIVTFAVATDYVLSTPYSLCYYLINNSMNPYNYTITVEKSFTTPNKAAVYAIFDLRYWAEQTAPARTVQILKDSNILVTLTNQPPLDKWVRIVVPLPKNAALTLKQVLIIYLYGTRKCKIWLDDFKIISK